MNILEIEREKIWNKIKTMGRDSSERRELCFQHIALSKKINGVGSRFWCDQCQEMVTEENCPHWGYENF